MENESAFDRAIRLAGGLASLAKGLNESIQTVSNWRGRGSVPANRCAAIQQLTGVDRRELRPNDWRDYWPEMDGAPPVPEQAQPTTQAEG